MPAVFPIVIYNGDPAWAARRDVAELIEPLPGGLTAYRPTLRYHLLDEGPLPSLALDRIHQATLPQLETWLDRIIDAPTWQAVFGAH